MPIPLTKDGLIPSRFIVVIQYRHPDGSKDYEVRWPGDKLNELDFKGPGADTWLLMSGDQIKVFVQDGLNDEICFMVRNEGGEVVDRRWVEQASA